MTNQINTATSQAMRIKCVRDGSEWGAYVRSGETYLADKGRIDWRLVGDNASTYITRSLFTLALSKGWIEAVS